MCSDYISNIHCRNEKVTMVLEIQLQKVLHYLFLPTISRCNGMYTNRSGCMDQRMYDNTGEMVVQKKKEKKKDLLVQACAHKTKSLGA